MKTMKWHKLRTLGSYRQVLPILLVALLGLVSSGTAIALTPPLPEVTLLSQSRVVVEGQILGVSLEEIESRKSAKFLVFRAWLAVDTVIKGDVPVGKTLEVIFRSISPESRPDELGGFADASYRPGEHVRAYLTWGFLEGGEAWTTVHWSGKRTLEPSEKELPGAVGQSITLNNSTAHRPGCEAEQGRWLPPYKAALFRECELPTQDAGLSCTDSRQCEGACLAPGSGAAPGQCSRYSPLGGGCWDFVSEGTVHSICQD